MVLFIVLYLGAEYVILHNGDVDDFNVIIINHNKYISDSKEGTLKIRIYIRDDAKTSDATTVCVVVQAQETA